VRSTPYSVPSPERNKAQAGAILLRLPLGAQRRFSVRVLRMRVVIGPWILLETALTLPPQPVLVAPTAMSSALSLSSLGNYGVREVRSSLRALRPPPTVGRRSPYSKPCSFQCSPVLDSLPGHTLKSRDTSDTTSYSVTLHHSLTHHALTHSLTPHSCFSTTHPSSLRSPAVVSIHLQHQHPSYSAAILSLPNISFCVTVQRP
jgi:hypothetical protein